MKLLFLVSLAMVAVNAYPSEETIEPVQILSTNEALKVDSSSGEIEEVVKQNEATSPAAAPYSIPSGFFQTIPQSEGRILFKPVIPLLDMFNIVTRAQLNQRLEEQEELFNAEIARIVAEYDGQIADLEAEIAALTP